MKRGQTKTQNPTLEEIRLRCAEIRSNWSERVRLKRSGLDQKRWQLPTVPILDSYESAIEPERN